jgi:DNA-binding Lrp family transcriptional regulator
MERVGMSIRMMSWAFHDSPQDLSPAQLVVLLALADGADDEGHVRYLRDTSQEALARKSRMSKKSVQRATDNLVERGILVRSQASVLDPYEYRILSGQSVASTMRQSVPNEATDCRIALSIDGSNSRGRKRKGSATPIPDDWSPSEAHRSQAAEKGLDIQLEADAFRAHAEANDRRVVVWDAAFRQWLIKARPVQTLAGGGFQW